MNRFSSLCNVIINNSDNKTSIREILNYLSKAEEHDILWMISLFMGDRPKRNVSTSLLREWAIEVTKIPEWLFQESYEVAGDLAETIAILLPDKDINPSVSLSDIIKDIQDLHGANEKNKKEYVVKMWHFLDRSSRFVFNKLITGTFRIAISNKLLINALAVHLKKDNSAISTRLNSKWSPNEISFEDLLINENNSDSLSCPYPFFSGNTLNFLASNLGQPDLWVAEWKWNGIRAQLIKRDGQIYLWSKNGELITQKFPEFDAFKQKPIDNLVLDGHLVAHDGLMALPLGSLDKRIKRKAVSKKLITEIPILFFCYDLLEFEGNDIRAKEYHERRKYLLSLFKKSNLADVFCLSEELKFRSWDKINDIRALARKNSANGIMLKKTNSSYGEGISKKDWWNWNIEPLRVHAVLIYATGMHSRRSSVFSDFTFAVHNPDGGENEFIPFTKTGLKLMEAEMDEISKFIGSNTFETFGPVRSVVPKLVFEISFDSISPSSRHKCGVSIHNSKVLHWAKEKTLDDANTIDDLRALLKEYESGE